LDDAWRRSRAIAPRANVWVVVSKELAPGVRAALPQLRPDRLIVERSPRDTAPALALACLRIQSVDPEAVMLLQPADHVINRPAVWAQDARRALAYAKAGGFVSIGVLPSGPHPGYGYIVCDRMPARTAARVLRFVEKPARPRAAALLRTKRCLWNTGSFAAGVATFVNELTRQRPDILAAAEAAVSGRFGLWRRLKPISVDYAVLEGAREIRAVKLHCGWDDLGSWDVAARLAPKPKRRLAILVDAPGSAVFARDRLIAVLGVPDVVVVDAPGAVLVVARSRAQEVRRVVAALATHGRKDLE
jgi:mannose-1-phosphate guanylyltransferase